MIRKDHGSNHENIETRLGNILDSLAQGRIISLFIEPASACNLRCNFCDFHALDNDLFSKNKGLMKFDLYQSIIEKVRASKYQIDQINFFLHGESLVNKSLVDMVRLARDAKIAKTLRLTSNGELLTLEKLKELIDAGIDEITVSLDTLDAQRYFEVKKSRRLDHLLQNIDDAISYLIETPKKIQFNIKCVAPREIHNMTQKDMEGVIDRYRHAAETSDHIHVHICDEFSWFSEGKQKTVPVINKPCEMPFYQIAISYDGVVSACCLDISYSLTIGNIASDASFDEIVESRALHAIRSAHLSGNLDAFPACQHCDSRTVVDVSTRASELRQLVHDWHSRSEKQEP